MMDATVKALWINALRSGDYKQAKNALECDGGNCCLGVLACALEVPKRLNRQGTHFTFEFTDHEGYKSTSPAMPPVGFHGLTGTEMYKLVALNDHDNYSFDQIADYIETNL